MSLDLSEKGSEKLGQGALGILAKALGEPMAYFLLNQICLDLGCAIRDITPGKYLPLIEGLEKELKPILGEKHSGDIVSALIWISLPDEKKGPVFEKMDKEIVKRFLSENKYVARREGEKAVNEPTPEPGRYRQNIDIPVDNKFNILERRLRIRE